MIGNKKPLIGVYNVNNEGSGDMYYKGANLLHTIRQLVNDDEKWRQILRGLNSEFYHKTVTTQEIENYISKQSGMDLSTVFNQYLRDVRIPTLAYRIKNKELTYKWMNVVKGFNMPIRVTIDGKQQLLKPTTTPKTMALESDVTNLIVDINFYVKSTAF